MAETNVLNCCDGGSNIKTVKTEENSRYILENARASSLLIHILQNIYVV